MKKYRNRRHAVLLYPDCSDHVSALSLIEKTYDYCYILHDKDTNEDGSLKKPHWHVVISCKHAVWNTALSKDLDIPLNYIQEIRNIDLMLEYLIHANEEDKHQYSLDDVKGSANLKQKLKKNLEIDTLSEGDKVIELIEIIENTDKVISISSFSRACATMGRWDVFRRSGAIFLKMIEEKNKKLQSS